MSKLLDIGINEQLLEILSQFDMQLEQIEGYEGYNFVDGLFPGIGAQAFEMERLEDGSVVVQVDIHILLPKQNIIESFVGHASSIEEAVAECFEQFEVNLLHTLIMAFWKNARKVENGVGTDIWEINGHRWQAVISNYGYRGELPLSEVIEDTDMMYETIEAHIKSRPLESDVYAFRNVYTNLGNGEVVVESLVNNEPNLELEKAISELPWKPLESYYTVRNFILVMKLVPESA